MYRYRSEVSSRFCCSPAVLNHRTGLHLIECTGPRLSVVADDDHGGCSCRRDLRRRGEMRNHRCRAAPDHLPLRPPLFTNMLASVVLRHMPAGFTRDWSIDFLHFANAPVHIRYM